MPILPFRELAAKGILKDPSPYQLDLDAWSGGANVRFHSNRVIRAPGFRTLMAAGVADGGLAFTFAFRTALNADTVFAVAENGRTLNVTASSAADVSPTGFIPQVGTGLFPAYTGVEQGGVVYLNRPTAVPTCFTAGAAAFVNLPNWDSTWRCRSLRAFGNYMVALNVTKGVNSFPNMVKWSDLTLQGAAPGSWNSVDPTTSAGENPLENLTSPIVDGVPLRNSLVIYSTTQTWEMYNADPTLIFGFRLLFSEGGMIAPNCGVEVEGKHYVFGPTDIYVHDGQSKQSISNRRVRDYVYRTLNTPLAEACFVAYMPKLDEILFAYPSGSTDAFFQGVTRCNRGAIYNISGDTWSFVDLPNVAALSVGIMHTAGTWASAGAAGLTWANIGGSWFDQGAGQDPLILMAAGTVPGRSTPAMLVYDSISSGSASLPLAPLLCAPAYVERLGIDLTQVGSDLVTYKMVRRVFPQVTVPASTQMTVQIGGSLTPSGPVAYAAPVPFDPFVQYKVDVIKGGRYLAIRMTVASMIDFEIAGFDVDVISAGNA